jgi:hypothetical protein
MVPVRTPADWETPQPGELPVPTGAVQTLLTQESLPLQDPQLVAVRLAPQLSAPVTEPQFFASRAQNAASLSPLQRAGAPNRT